MRTLTWIHVLCFYESSTDWQTDCCFGSFVKQCQVKCTYWYLNLMCSVLTQDSIFDAEIKKQWASYSQLSSPEAQAKFLDDLPRVDYTVQSSCLEWSLKRSGCPVKMWIPEKGSVGCGLLIRETDGNGDCSVYEIIECEDDIEDDYEMIECDEWAVFQWMFVRLVTGDHEVIGRGSGMVLSPLNFPFTGTKAHAWHDNDDHHLRHGGGQRGVSKICICEFVNNNTEWNTMTVSHDTMPYFTILPSLPKRHANFEDM